MKEIERFEKLKELGYKYDPETGDLFGKRGHKIKRKDKAGYILCGVYDENRKQYKVLGHRFIWWLTHNEIPKVIDHINREKTDNRLVNLRNTTHAKNCENKFSKGYTKRSYGFEALIKVDRKQIYLGSYKTEQEAHQAYLDAKKIYHKI